MQEVTLTFQFIFLWVIWKWQIKWILLITFSRCAQKFFVWRFMSWLELLGRLLFFIILFIIAKLSLLHYNFKYRQLVHIISVFTHSHWVFVSMSQRMGGVSIDSPQYRHGYIAVCVSSPLTRLFKSCIAQWGILTTYFLNMNIVHIIWATRKLLQFWKNWCKTIHMFI